MKLNFKREQLRDNVLRNCSILDTKDIISNGLSSIIRLVFSGKKLSLISYNSDITIKNVMDISEEVDEEIKLTVNGVSLKNVINSFKCEDIILEIKDENIIFKNKKQRYKISYRTDVFFPDIETGNKEVASKIDKKFFQYVIDKTLFCASKAKDRPILSYIWFGEKVILSGDDNRFTKIKNNLKELSEVAVQSTVLIELSNVLSDKAECDLYYYTDGTVLFFIVDETYFISCNMPAESYPVALSESITTQDKKVILDTNVFLEGVKFISNTINDANHEMFLELLDDTLSIYTETDIFDGYNEIPIISQKNTEFKKLLVCINYKFLLDILNRIKDSNNKIMLEYLDSQSPINIRANEEPFIHSIATINEMPKKVKEEKETKVKS